MLYITFFFLNMNISFMLIFIVHLPYSTHYSFLMKYENKYFLPFSNMSLIYTGFTVSLITGKSLSSLLHIIHVSPTTFCLSVVNTPSCQYVFIDSQLHIILFTFHVQENKMSAKELEWTMIFQTELKRIIEIFIINFYAHLVMKLNNG